MSKTVSVDSIFEKLTKYSKEIFERVEAALEETFGPDRVNRVQLVESPRSVKWVVGGPTQRKYPRVGLVHDEGYECPPTGIEIWIPDFGGYDRTVFEQVTDRPYVVKIGDSLGDLSWAIKETKRIVIKKLKSLLERAKQEVSQATYEGQISRAQERVEDLQQTLENAGHIEEKKTPIIRTRGRRMSRTLKSFPKPVRGQLCKIRQHLEEAFGSVHAYKARKGPYARVWSICRNTRSSGPRVGVVVQDHEVVRCDVWRRFGKSESVKQSIVPSYSFETFQWFIADQVAIELETLIKRQEHLMSKTLSRSIYADRKRTLSQYKAALRSYQEFTNQPEEAETSPTERSESKNGTTPNFVSEKYFEIKEALQQMREGCLVREFVKSELEFLSETMQDLMLDRVTVPGPLHTAVLQNGQIKFPRLKKSSEELDLEDAETVCSALPELAEAIETRAKMKWGDLIG